MQVGSGSPVHLTQYCVCRHAQGVGVHKAAASPACDHVLLMSIEGLVVWKKVERDDWGGGPKGGLFCVVIGDKGGSCDLILL